jgi:hypothetical protein
MGAAVIEIKRVGRLGLFIDYVLHLTGAGVVFLLFLFVSVGLGGTVEWLVDQRLLHGYQKWDAEWAEWGLSRLDLFTLGLYCVCETIKLARALIMGVVDDWRS